MSWLKAGAHVTAGARDGYGPVAAKSAMVTSLFADAFIDTHPNTYRIFRPFHLYDYSLDGPEIVLKGASGGASDAQIKADAIYYANRAATLADEALHRVDAIQLINEVGGNDADELRRVVLYEQHAAPVLLARGYRLVALNLAPNSPDWGLPLWKEILAPHIRQLWQAGHIYGRHVYFDIPPYDDNWQRLRWELDYLRTLGATGSVAVTELGFVTFPVVDEFMAGVGEWLDSMKEYPELLGTSLFTFGNWWQASVTPAAEALAATMQAPESLPVPRQTGEEAQVNYVVAANLLPQDATLAEKFIVSFDAHPQKQTVLQSADDAAKLVAPGKEGSKVIVYEPDRFGGVAAIDAWLKARGVVEVEYRHFNGGNPDPNPPTGANLLANPSFEGGWTDNTLYSTTQDPAGWAVAWNTGSGFPNPHSEYTYLLGEAVHKTKDMLPAHERGVFIWDGETCFKVFAGHRAFWARLKQSINIPAGTYRLSTPIWVDAYHGGSEGKNYNVDAKQAEIRVVANGEEVRPWTFLRAGGKREVITEWQHLGGVCDLAVHLRMNWPINNNFFIDGWALTAVSGSGGQPPPPPPPPPNPPTPVPQNVRVGLHMRADPGDIPAADIAEAKTLKAGSIKVLDAHSGPSIAKLRIELPNAHFVVRAFLDFGGRFVTPDEFFSWTKDNIQRAIAAIGHDNYVIELHNEPNLTPEGLYTSWDGPGGFNSWIKIVLEQYRSLLPGAKFIYPGLSPGWGVSGLRFAHDAWLTQSIATMRLFDGVGVHSYWSNPFPMAQALAHVKLYEQVSRPIYITEASRNDDTATIAQRAGEYNTFVKECGKIAGVQSVNYFVSSASNPVFWPECWITEHGGSKGIATAMVGNS